MTLKNIDFKGGAILYDSFNIVPNIPFNEQASKLNQNLLYVSYQNELYVIDIGWYPNNDENGQFILSIIKNNDWHNPLYKKETRNFTELELYLQAYIYIIRNLLNNDQNNIVFEKNDKRRIYWLIDQYLSNAIDASTFCDEYYYCIAQEIDSNTLTDLEQKTFSELSTISDRFSPYEKDHKVCPNAFYTEDELKEKVVETKKLLRPEL